MRKPHFDKVKILLTDNDVWLARVIMQNLKDLGFPHIHHVRSASKALEYLQGNPVDIVITEWMLEPINGLELVRQIRTGKVNRAIPIIMLTGKGEATDVAMARDVGITEFLVKPFTIHSLFKRIEYLVDHARDFVESKNFVGHDRRRRAPAPLGDERRQPKTPEVTLIPAKFELKKKLGIQGPLASVITPEILAEAEKSIEAMQDESLQWIKDDLKEFEEAFLKAKNNEDAEDNILAMVTTALSIKSRGGVFGYHLASDIAWMLYLFLGPDYDPSRSSYNLVVAKCIEALKVIFAQNIKKHEGIGAELAKELKQLIDKQKRILQSDDNSISVHAS